MTNYIVELTIQYESNEGTHITETKRSEHIATSDKIVIGNVGSDGLDWARTKNAKLKKVKVYKEIHCEE